MKKLLILMLVLGLTSAANAVVDLSLGVSGELVEGGSVEIYVIAGTTDPWEGFIGYDTNPFDNVQATGNAGDSPVITLSPGNFVGYYFISALDFDPENLPDIATGIQFTGDLTSTGSDYGTTYSFTLYADDWQTILDTQSVTVIPEPMTIVLLGLGGLFLRRRK